MDAISYSYADKQAKRIKKFIENPDSTSGILTQPAVIQTGEVVTVPLGRTAILAGTQIDGDLVIDGDVFIPTGTSIDFSNGIKVNGTNIALSIPTSYNLLSGNLSVDNTVLTNGFGTTVYTGNGTTQSITTSIDMATQWGNTIDETYGGLNWIKNRASLSDNILFDSVNGNNFIRSNATTANTAATVPTRTSTGLNVTISDGAWNANATNYVSWNFQTTHRRTGVTNHGKAYTEHYNPFTGFTIIKYEGSGLAGHEIPHSLGRKLGFATTKILTNVGDWNAFYKENSYLFLSSTSAETASTLVVSDFNSISTVIGTGTNSNASSNQYIMYCWANSYFDESGKLIGNFEIGVYQGTGVAGNKVQTRGKPAWLMVKRLDTTGDWQIIDNQRVSGSLEGRLYANLSNADSNVDMLTFDVNGFTLIDTAVNQNASGGQYLYMVVYDNDSGSGKSKYPKATDTANVQINNGIIPLAHGIDSNGSKNSIVVANETITGVTYTEGKNYLYKTDTGYGVKAYEPRYLASELVRKFAGEQPDYYNAESNKWFNCDAGAELVTNGTFDSNTSGWTADGSNILSVSNGTMLVNRNNSTANGAKQTILTTIGKKYTIRFKVTSLANSGTPLLYIGSTVNGYDIGSYNPATTGTSEYSFVAQTTNTYLQFGVTTSVTGIVGYDDITCFPADIVPTTEITESRNYMNHIVHADADGGVLYVEELPKIEYKNDLKIDNLSITSGFDLGQSWKDVISNRFAGVTYTNNTGKPIEVAVRSGASAATGIITLYIDDMQISLHSNSATTNKAHTVSGTVPNGSSYRVDITTWVILTWSELR